MGIPTLTTKVTERSNFVTGDATGLTIPAHPEALMAAGQESLTKLLHAFGSLGADNRITAMSARPCLGGSTGKKLFLTLDYARPEPGLERVLFAKFSRDFDDARRDWQRTEMAGEALFMPLTRQPGFPVRAPQAAFADYHAASGTGFILTECIAYGEGRVEPHRRKCLDWQTMDAPLSYYRATVTALARIAGAHKSGALGDGIEAKFPFNPATGSADPFRYSQAELAVQLQQGRHFARDCPRLMPPEIRDPAFLAQLERDVWTVCEHEAALRAYLISNPALIALNHWNAHIDNCWFWREQDALHCGLIDWGRVGQLTVGAALWGGLSAAHHDIWDHHLDELLALFAHEYHAHGGPLVTPDELKQHLTLHIAVMAVARLFSAPEIIRFRMPHCTKASGPRDPMFTHVSMDPPRNYLSVYTTLLKHWRREDFGGAARRLVG